MGLGVIADLHGNRVALEAVVADGRREGVDRWWVLGDLVAIGADPVATLELVADLPQVEVIRGNTDRYVLTRDRPPPYADDVLADPSLMDVFVTIEASFSWTRGALAGPGWLPWLEALPLEVGTTLDDGTRLLGVHATVGRDDGPGISPHRPEEELRAELVGTTADVVLAGHTHQPTDRRIGAVRIVNGGSVSNPITDDLRAGYVIVHADRRGHAVEHRRVPYDHDAVICRARESGHPAHDYIAAFQLGDQLQYPSRRPGAPVIR